MLYIPIERARRKLREEFFAAEMGISMLFFGGRNRHSGPTLYHREAACCLACPRVHLAILRPAALRADLHQVFAEAKHQPYLVLITGPSRTADIELTVTLGVHGPKSLYVLGNLLILAFEDNWRNRWIIIWAGMFMTTPDKPFGKRKR